MSSLGQGVIVSVAEVLFGSELALDAAAAATSLTLVDAVDFTEAGGALTIGVETIGYASADLDTDVVTLTTPLAAGYVAGEPVLLSPRTTERVATVVLDSGGEAIEARVPHALFDKIAEGTRDESVAENVSLTLDGGEWVIVDVLGREPSVDGSFIDPATLPDTSGSDGVPPAVAPAPTVIGGIGALHVRWDGITNSTPVTYEVHVSLFDGFAPDITTLYAETESTAITIKSLADGTPLTYGPEDNPTIYYVRLVAKDDDPGTPPVSAQASASLHRIGNEEISALYAYFGEVVADQIVSGELSAEITLSGQIMTDVSGRRVVVDADGVRLYPQSGDVPLVDLPTDPDADASFNGSATMRNLSVTDSLALSSTNNHVKTNAAIALDSSVGAPATGPGYGVGYDTFTITNIAPPAGSTGSYAYFGGIDVDATEALLVVHGTSSPWNWSNHPNYVAIAPPGGGAVTSYWSPFVNGVGAGQGNVIDVCKLGGNYYAVGKLGSNFEDLTSIRRFNSSKVQTHEVQVNFQSNILCAYPAGIFTDGTYIYVAFWNAVGTKFAVRRYNAADLTGAVQVDTLNGYSLGYQGGFGGAIGTFDYGASRLVLPWPVATTWNPNNYHVQTYTVGASYTVQQLESFPSPGGGNTTPTSALTWNASTSEFLAAPLSGNEVLAGGVASRTISKLTGAKWTAAADATWWLSATSAYYDGSDALQYQTPQSPRTKLTMVKRARLAITGPTLPPDDPSYSYDPNWQRIFVGKGTTEPALASMFYVGRTNVANPITYMTTMPPTSGVNPPTSANFPNATPGKLVSVAKRLDLLPRISLAGDGVANVDGLLPPGSLTMYGGAVVAGTSEPPGWKLCNGQTLNTALYPDLFAAIGYSYGGSGTSFLVPDLRDQFPIGVSGTKALGIAGGSATKAVPVHTHTTPNHVHTDNFATNNVGAGHTHGPGTLAASVTNDRATGTGARANSNITGNTDNTGSSHTHGMTGGITSSGAGVSGAASGSAFDVMNPYVPLNFLIKT